jgi:hypothetical protein
MRRLTSDPRGLCRPQDLSVLVRPEKYEIPHPEEMIAEAERELEEWKRQQAVKRVQRKANK